LTRSDATHLNSASGIFDICIKIKDIKSGRLANRQPFAYIRPLSKK
jgi:hypothetical protein